MIPEVLDFETHMLEYFPGTYGDSISGIVSYSVDGFYDPDCDDYAFDDSKSRPGDYWNANDAIVKRNRYLLSCRGNGYEHVETYTEVMLGHKVFLDFPILLSDELKQLGRHPTKLMFNTHMKYEYAPVLFKEQCRTLHNNFTHTQTLHLTMPMDYDILFLSACNEYYTSQSHRLDDTNWKVLYQIFRNRIRNFHWVNKHVPEDNLLNIGNIINLDISVAERYGTVNEEKFNAYTKQYSEEKLILLQHIARKRMKEINGDASMRQRFEGIFETTYDDFEYEIYDPNFIDVNKK